MEYNILNLVVLLDLHSNGFGMMKRLEGSTAIIRRAEAGMTDA